MISNPIFSAIKRYPGLALMLVITLFYCVGLGARPLANPDEGRYCEIPREMISRGDWVTPHLNGLKYFEKPPLVYWLQASVMDVLGQLDEWVLRLVPLFFALLGCAATYIIAKRWFCLRTALIATLVLATSPLYYALSRMIILDMAASTLICSAIFSMIQGLCLVSPRHPHETHGMQEAQHWIAASYAFCALATLAKGMIGFLIPGTVICLWIVIEREWRWFAKALNPIGIIVFLAIAVPWHVLVALRNPEFVDFYFLREHILRLTTTIHVRYQPIWFFLPVVIFGFFPWTCMLWQAFRNAWQSPSLRGDNQTKILRALVVMIGVVMGLYSLSQSKLIPYILPIFPPLAILVACYVEQQLSKQALVVTSIPGQRVACYPHKLRWTFISIFGLSLLIGAAGYWGILDARHLDAHAMIVPLGVLVSLIMLTSVMSWFIFWRRGLLASFITLCLGMAIFLVSLNHFSALLQKPSTKTIAHYLHQQSQFDVTKAPECVFAFQNYPQDLPFYLQSTISVVDWHGELSFGIAQNPQCHWMIDAHRFWHVWRTRSSPIYVVIADRVWATFEQQWSDIQKKFPSLQPAKILLRIPGYRLVSHD